MIPFLDLKAQYHSIKAEVDAAIAGVLESNQFILGREVAAFETEFAAYCQTQHAIGVNSGTSALHLALLAAEQAANEVLSLPMYAELTDDQIGMAASALREGLHA